MINSRINKFIKERPRLLVCQISIEKLEHSFLKHDSFIDCREICPLSNDDLIRHVGELSPQTIQNTIKAVRECSVLERRYKNYILSQLDS